MSVKVTIDVLKNGGIKPIGCRICGGELVPALSLVKRGELQHSFSCVGHSKAAGLFAAAGSDGLYVSSNGLSFIKLSTATGKAFAFEDVKENKPRILMYCGSRCLAHSDDSFTIYTNPVSLSCGVMHCGRLFGIDADDRYILRWSGGGADDWDENIKGAGSLKLDPERGEALDIVPFCGKLVIVREYGLTVIKMYGSPENFSVVQTDTDTDGIYGGTARTVLRKLYFYTASGLRCFDGASIKKVNHRFADDIASSVCSAEYGGKYFLSCILKDGGAAILVYDPEDGESYLVGGGADCMCSSDGVYAFKGFDAYKLAEGGEYCFSSGKIYFGTDGQKTLLNLKIDGNADVTVSNGEVSRTFINARGIIRPRLKGRYFTVEVRGTNRVRALTAQAEVANEI